MSVAARVGWFLGILVLGLPLLCCVWLAILALLLAGHVEVTYKNHHFEAGVK